MSLSPEDARLYGRIGAHVAHARHGGEAMTAKARASFLARFEREVDPDNELAPEERERRAMHARKAHFSRLAAKSAESRRRHIRAENAIP